MPRRPTRDEILTVIAEVESLDKTLARFPGLERGDLFDILRSAPAAAPGAAVAASVRPASAPEPAPPAGGPLVVFTDGASRGNPGPASIGVVISRPDGQVVETISETIGRATNNHAEYEAVRAALSRARDLKADRVDLRADSELVVRQLGGQYQVRSPELRPIYEAIKKLESSFPGGVRYRHVRREQNQEADALANQALDRGY